MSTVYGTRTFGLYKYLFFLLNIIHSILHHWAILPDHIVIPEKRIDNYKPDHVVMKLTFGRQFGWYPYVIYEGKRQYVRWHRGWAKIRSELFGQGNNCRRNMYCIGAMGRRVAFWTFRVGAGNAPNSMHLMTVQRFSNRRGTVQTSNDSSAILQTYDLIDNEEDIRLILTHMFSYRPQ